MNDAACDVLQHAGAADAQTFARPGGPLGAMGSDYNCGTIAGRRVLLVASGGLRPLWRAGAYCRGLGRMVWSPQLGFGLSAVEWLQRNMRAIWAEVE